MINFDYHKVEIEKLMTFEAVSFDKHIFVFKNRSVSVFVFQNLSLKAFRDCQVLIFGYLYYNAGI